MIGSPMMDGGGVALQFCGAPRRLRFDWNALGVLRSAYGAEFQDKVNAGILGLDFELIAQALSAAVGGAVTPEEIRANPPGIHAAQKALFEAFTLAYHGPDGPPEEYKRPLAVARRIARAILSRMLSALG